MKPHPEYKRWMDKRKIAQKHIIHWLDQNGCWKKYRRRINKWAAIKYKIEIRLIMLEKQGRMYI